MKDSFHFEFKKYLIPAKSSIGRTSIVESRENFNEIVATVLFILHFKTEETQMDIFSGLKVQLDVIYLYKVFLKSSKNAKSFQGNLVVNHTSYLTDCFATSYNSFKIAKF